jgi:Flp pilus assembly protein TadG
MIHRSHRPRRGATVVEFAVVVPVVVLLIFGFLILGMGVARYQEMAFLAREGARYASVHGGQYRADADLPVGDLNIWLTDVRTNGILPLCSYLNTDDLEVNVTYSTGNNYPATAGNGGGSQNQAPNQGITRNVVTVIVTYPWTPEGLGFMFPSGAVTLTSTASMPMSY